MSINISAEALEKLGSLAAVLSDVQALVRRILTEETCSLTRAEQDLLDGVISVHQEYHRALQAVSEVAPEQLEEEKIAELLVHWKRIHKAYDGGVLAGAKEPKPENWRYLFSGKCFVALDSDGSTGYFLFSPGMKVRLSPELQEFFSLEGGDSFRDQNEQSHNFDIVRPAKIRIDDRLLNFGPTAQLNSLTGDRLAQVEAERLLSNRLIEKGVLRRKVG